MQRKVFLLVTVLMLLCFITAAQEESTPSSSTDYAIAAIVTGEIITQDTLAASAQLVQIFQLIIQEFPIFGQTLFTTPEGDALLYAYQLGILDTIITSRLVIQQAKQHDIAPDEKKVEEQVKEQLNQIIEQNQLTIEQIEAILSEQGSSLDEYRQMMRESFAEQSMAQDLYTLITQPVVISSEQISAYYQDHEEEFAAEDGSISPLDEVREQIHEDLLENAQANAWNTWFDDVKDKAEIEILF